MPMKWVEPDEFLSEDGPDGPVTVFHAYKDQNWDHALQFHFTLSEVNEEEHTFDVRELKCLEGASPALRDGVMRGNREDIGVAITIAIQSGELKKPKE